MNSLEELNYFSQGLIEFGDLRGPGIDWAGEATNQSLTIYEGQTHTIPKGCDMLSIRNYQTLQTYFEIDLTNLPTAGVTFPTLPGYIIQNPQVGAVSRVTGLTNSDDYALMLTSLITLPQDYSGTFTYTVTVGTILGVERTWTVTVTVLEVTLWEDSNWYGNPSALTAQIENFYGELTGTQTRPSYGQTVRYGTENVNIRHPNITDSGNVPGVTYTVTISFNIPEMINSVSTANGVVYANNFTVNSTTKTITFNGTKEQCNRTLGIWDTTAVPAIPSNPYVPSYPGFNIIYNTIPYKTDLIISYTAVSSLGEEETIKRYWIINSFTNLLDMDGTYRNEGGKTGINVRSRQTYTPNTAKTINSPMYIKSQSDNSMIALSGFTGQWQDSYNLTVSAKPNTAVNNLQIQPVAIPSNLTAYSFDVVSYDVTAYALSNSVRTDPTLAISVVRRTNGYPSFLMLASVYNQLVQFGGIGLNYLIGGSNFDNRTSSVWPRIIGFYQVSVNGVNYIEVRYDTPVAGEIRTSSSPGVNATVSITNPYTANASSNRSQVFDRALSINRFNFAIKETQYQNLSGSNVLKVGDPLYNASFLANLRNVSSFGIVFKVLGEEYREVIMNGAPSSNSLLTPGTITIQVTPSRNVSVSYNRYDQLQVFQNQFGEFRSIESYDSSGFGYYRSYLKTNNSLDSLPGSDPRDSGKIIKKIATSANQVYIALANQTSTDNSPILVSDTVVRIFKLNDQGTKYFFQQDIQIPFPPDHTLYQNKGIGAKPILNVCLNADGDRLVVSQNYFLHNRINKQARIYTFTRTGNIWTQLNYFNYNNEISEVTSRSQELMKKKNGTTNSVSVYDITKYNPGTIIFTTSPSNTLDEGEFSRYVKFATVPGMAQLNNTEVFLGDYSLNDTGGGSAPVGSYKWGLYNPLGSYSLLTGNTYSSKPFTQTINTIPLSNFTSPLTINFLDSFFYFQFANGMDMSSDGNYLAVTSILVPRYQYPEYTQAINQPGKYANDSNRSDWQHFCSIYTYSAGNWVFQQKFNIGNSNFVKLNATGNTLVCSGQFKKEIWTRTGSNWTLNLQLSTVGDVEFGNQGSQCDISADGNYVFFVDGGYQINSTTMSNGKISIYKKNGTYSLLQEITNADLAYCSIAINENGSVLIVHNNGYNIGSSYKPDEVRVYYRNESNQYVLQNNIIQSNSWVWKPFIFKLSSDGFSILSFGMSLTTSYQKYYMGFDYYRANLIYDYNSTSRTLSIKGTSAAINAALNFLTVTPATGQTADYLLLYEAQPIYYVSANGTVYLKNIQSEYWDNTGN
jgi:hypothetical protein